jgi:mycofactocin system glycosyltransferase
VVLDPATRQVSTRTLAGGSPRRLLRLSPAGWHALHELQGGGADSRAARVLGRRLLDAGMAHPRPRAGDARERITVLIPARDRLEQLEHCLSALDADTPVIVVDDGSEDAQALAELAARRRARLIRRPLPGGPAAARNAALASATTELVAFLDSDCVARGDWLGALVGHFDDPLVAAVAPRVRPSPDRSVGLLGRYLASRSPLDMGGREAAVEPGHRVAYVPTAALLVRRGAIDRGFDQELRYGEDVDFLWRLHDAGWRVRYAPDVEVHHDEPVTLRRALARRFRYGTSAAALSARHPRRLAPVRLARAPAVAAVLVLARRPKAAAGLIALSGLAFVRRLRSHGLPPAVGVRWFGQAALQSSVSLTRYAATLGLPAALLMARQTRKPALLVLLVLPALQEWSAGERELDPPRWTALALIDDAAYAAGVWWGCIRSREHRPLLPRFR